MSQFLQEGFLSKLQYLESLGAINFFKNLLPDLNLQQITILCDISDGMHAMFDTLKYSVSCIAWLSLRSQISVKVIPFNDNPQLNVPVFSTQSDYRRLVYFLESLKLQSSSNINKVLAESKPNNNNITILVSGLLNSNTPFFEWLYDTPTQIMILHLFEPSLFVTSNCQFITNKGNIYRNEDTYINIVKFLQEIDTICEKLHIPIVRMAQKDGWLHLAYYLFNYLEYCNDN